MNSNAAGDMSSIQIRVLVASTGQCVPLTLFSHELTVANIRKHLAGVVPLNDQILLLGPPYKVPKDAAIQSAEMLAALRLGDAEDDYSEAPAITEDSRHIRRKPVVPSSDRAGARRLFLFSKQALSDTAPEPIPCVLQPMDIVLPTQPDASPVALSLRAASAAASSPLFQALQVYERRFMLNLCQGRALADAADMRMLSTRACITEQLFITRAIRAAVYNLSDHRNGAIRTRTEFTAEFQAVTAMHGQVLDNFDNMLNSLAAIPLHPALVAIARASGQVGVQTLLDTVPVEREKAWAHQCRTSHSRLVNLFNELDSAFTQLGNTREAMQEELSSDTEMEERIHQLSILVEGQMANIRDLQEERLHRLVAVHKDVVAIILKAMEGEQGNSQSVAHAAFANLESMSQASADLIPSMISDDESMKQIMIKVADSKTMAMKHVKNRLRQVSLSQSAIQRVLANVGVLKEALSQQVENMSHLDHVAQLKHAYRDFIAEIRRRKAYCGAVTATAMSLMDRLSLMRIDEVKAREAFLRGPGRHLMPCFFETFVPTLATPPPLFTPQLPSMIEADSLPLFGPLDDDKGLNILSQRRKGSVVYESIDMSTLDVRTDNQEHSTIEDKGAKQLDYNLDSGSSLSLINIRTASTNEKGSERLVGKKQSLIVSADETSTNDIIMESGSQEEMGGNSDAERKTLLFENAMLRQIVERMSGKSIQPYLLERTDEENQKTSQLRNIASVEKNPVADESEYLRKELEQTKSRLKEVTVELEDMKRKDELSSRVSDKISHSSFNIGDVALFMPTGRVGTYLAFHTNCPHRYLSSDCIRGNPNFILGRIVFQDTQVAGDTTSSNPHGLIVGTKFWVLTVEVLGK